MNKFNDNDIREALRRSEAKRQPAEVPGDFLANVMSEIEAESKTVKIWRWVAAAACIALVAGIGSAILFTGRTIQESEIIAETPVVENAENEQSAEIINDTVTEPVAVPEPKVEAPKAKPTAKPKPNPIAEQPTADNAPETDYPSPARMDEFIAKLADNQGADKTILNCSNDVNSANADLVYIFHETNDFDLFGRLIMSVTNFPETTQGYILNHSSQQFFFSINDERSGQSYYWIAERVSNEKTFLYSLHSSLGAEGVSTCYQQYHNKLTFNEFNTNL